MNTILLTAGVVALMAAVIGGGLKAFNIEMPVLQGGGVRAGLAALGIVFLVAAFLLRDDAGGGGGGGDDGRAASYQRQVVATCNAVRRRSGRNTLGMPKPSFEGGSSNPTFAFDRDRMIAGMRGTLSANRRRFELLFDTPAPESLRDDAKVARSRFRAFDRESRSFVAAFADALPSEPTLADLETASAPLEDPLDEATAELEGAMTRLAGRECSITTET